MSNLNSTVPTENSQGYQVWKPSTGIVFDDGRDHAESYAGIIAALRDGIVKAGNAPKAYPHNFAGIIAAIQDLEAAEAQKPPVLPSPIPPGSEIDSGTGDLNIIIKPEDGLLWFDTRQGRLFVAIDDEWWQTNGADGLAYVQPAPPSTTLVVTGQFWYEPVNGELYVFNGTDWVLTSDDGAFQTTATVPLYSRQLGTPPPTPPFTWEPGTGTPGYDVNVDPINIQDPFTRLMDTQMDFNGWILDSFWDLDRSIEEKGASVEIGDTPPGTPEAGDLWFDTDSIELSIYYDDGNTQQWVPTSVSHVFDDTIRIVTESITAEQASRVAAIAEVEELVETTESDLTNKINNVRIEIGRRISEIQFPDPGLSAYSTLENTETVKQDLITQLNDATSLLEIRLNTLKSELDVAESGLLTEINTNATEQTASIDALSAAIPDISDLASIATVDTKIAAITNGFLPRSGGTLNGRFVLQKNDISLAALDFSSEQHYSRNALVLKAMIDDDSTVSFGSTDTNGEVAFSFSDKEEFTWQHSVEDKVFSIDRNGAAAEVLYLGDFAENGTNGRVIHNRIDVKDRLITYQTAFEQLRQNVSLATDFDSLKSGILTVLQNV